MASSGHQGHGHAHAGQSLNSLAFAATVHCLTGCAIGEVAGMALGTALGWSNGGTIVASIVLAFVFGYGLTSVPLLRAGLPVRRVIPLALASDTLSITTMEVVDNAFILLVPGAMDAGLADGLFWASLASSLAIIIQGLVVLFVGANLVVLLALRWFRRSRDTRVAA